MPSESGLIYDFSQVHLVIGAGFRVDAFADAGFNVAWQGDMFTMVTGADDNTVIVKVNNSSAILTPSMMQSAKFLAYASSWLTVGLTRPVNFEDANGLTFMTSTRSIPRQLPDMQFNNGENARAIDILCPNLRGAVGGLKAA